MAENHSRATAVGNSRWVAPLCWAAVLLDGFDLVVLGTVIPVLVKNSVFGFTDASVTTVATTGLIGMTIGAMTIGTVTDYLGRRKVMIFAVAVFSIFTLAVAFSNSIFTFGLYRFLAGLGLGGCLPTATHPGDRIRAQGQGVECDHHGDDGLPRWCRADRAPRAGRHGQRPRLGVDVRDRRRPRTVAGAVDDEVPAGVRGLPRAEGARPDPRGRRANQHQPSRRAVQRMAWPVRRSRSGPLRSWAWSWCTA